MAMDWMKVELELPDKPEVHAIAARLEIDPDAVVGKLLRVWQWFNKHTIDGNAVGVTFALPDRIVCVSGFGEAMHAAGWLEQMDGVLHMPKFDRHTSESAKKRALTARRVAKHKEKTNAKTNADSVSDSVSEALPRIRRRVNKKVNQKDSASLSLRFDDFWKIYPRKADVKKARKAWESKKLDPMADKIIAAVLLQARGWDDPKYIPLPTTWLNGERWDDEVTPSPRPSASLFASAI